MIEAYWRAYGLLCAVPLFQEKPEMTDAMTAWHAEHAYFRQLLDLLHKQVDVFHTGKRPNYQLMLDIVSCKSRTRFIIPDVYARWLPRHETRWPVQPFYRHRMKRLSTCWIILGDASLPPISCYDHVSFVSRALRRMTRRR
jgi:hypothetical protein